MIEAHHRSIVKAVSWRFVATLTTMSIVFIFTRKFVLTIEVGILEVLSKMLFYYIHERVWAKIKWGKVSHPLEDLKVIREAYKNQIFFEVSGNGIS